MNGIIVAIYRKDLLRPDELMKFTRLLGFKLFLIIIFVMIVGTFVFATLQSTGIPSNISTTRSPP